jgi:eukaryotic-like serine/threonine-protein kinase
MSLQPGTSFAHYHVVAPLGVGGMGEVYRARDTKLDRDVALKVLPAAFAADPERLARFEREAKTLAALNHPHIAHIHGVEDVAGVRALVMELVEGPTLAERLAQGALPLDEALPLARQIAVALEAAHEQGIVHRDLKPANIKLRPDGTIKVLDFGLAKAMSPDPGSAGGAEMLAASPTMTSPAMTKQGVILGTAAYMAPEQAKGRSADARSDIWAFGVVLFEMLTGRTLFDGESTVDVLGAVLRQPIDLAQLPSTAPVAVRRLLRRCLERDPRRRLHHIADARLEIVDGMEAPESDASTRSGPPTRMRGVALAGWAVALLALAALGLWTTVWRPAPPTAPVAYRFTIPRPATDASAPAVSPDGRYIAYAAPSGLWLRALDEAAPRLLGGTGGAREPFWSPDGRALAFFAGDTVKRISIAGGPAETLAPIPGGWPAGSWSRDGTILVEITENPESEGWYVLSAGSRSLSRLRAFAADRPINPDKAFPAFLPDGEHFLFTHPAGDTATLQVGSVRSDETRPLVPADSRAFFASPGYVLYVRSGTLFAQPFDATTRRMAGEPVAVTDEVDYFSPTGEAGFSVSQEGTLVVRRPMGRSELRWFDRDGRAASRVLERDYYNSVALGPDGQRLLVEIKDARRSTTDLWMVDLERNVSTRLTSSPRSELWPLWSPDGSQLVFSADWDGPPNLYIADAAGGAPRVLVPFDRQVQIAGSWTPDGRQLLYAKRSHPFNRDIWIVDVATGDRRPLLATEFNEEAPALSPDGQWLAYVSDASGRREIYLRSFPAGTWQVRLSVDGGLYPAWRRDGRELFYYEPGGAIMAVAIAPDTAGRVRPGGPARLFPVDERMFLSFAVTPDGQRFLLNLTEPGGISPPDEVIVDWTRLMSASAR